MPASSDAEIKKAIEAYLAHKSPAEVSGFCKYIADNYEADATQQSCWVTVQENLSSCITLGYEENAVEGKLENLPPTLPSPVSSKPLIKPSFFTRGFLGTRRIICCCFELSEYQLEAIESASSTKSSTSSIDDDRTSRQVIPSVDTKQVDALVDVLLSDPQFGSSSTPDFLERTIYTLAITKTLQTIIDTVYSVENFDVFGFSVKCRQSASRALKRGSLPKMNIDRAPITALVQALLRDPDINLTIIPDKIEQHMYENVIILVFSIMQVFCLQNIVPFFGHEVKMEVSPLPAGFIDHKEVAERWKKSKNNLSEAEMNAEIDKFSRQVIGSSGKSFTQQLTVRPLIKALISLIHLLGEEFLKDLSLNFFGNKISFTLGKKKGYGR